MAEQGAGIDVPDLSGFRKATCTCGPPPERCVQDGTVLTQQSWNRANYRNQPRYERETDLSMLIGAHWSVEDACTYVSRENRPPSRRKLDRAGVRRTTAGRLREAGFGVVHTPGKFRTGPHASVVWPGDDPLNRHEVPWSDEVSARFDACFAGNREN